MSSNESTPSTGETGGERYRPCLFVSNSCKDRARVSAQAELAREGKSTRRRRRRQVQRNNNWIGGARGGWSHRVLGVRVVGLVDLGHLWLEVQGFVVGVGDRQSACVCVRLLRFKCRRTAADSGIRGGSTASERLHVSGQGSGPVGRGSQLRTLGPQSLELWLRLSSLGRHSVTTVVCLCR